MVEGWVEHPAGRVLRLRVGGSRDPWGLSISGSRSGGITRDYQVAPIQLVESTLHRFVFDTSGVSSTIEAACDISCRARLVQHDPNRGRQPTEFPLVTS